VRAAAALPDQAREIYAFADAFEAQRYAGREASVGQLREQLSKLRRALPWRFTRAEPAE
jgi:hypothetical protein